MYLAECSHLSWWHTDTQLYLRKHHRTILYFMSWILSFPKLRVLFVFLRDSFNVHLLTHYTQPNRQLSIFFPFYRLFMVESFFFSSSFSSFCLFLRVESERSHWINIRLEKLEIMDVDPFFHIPVALHTFYFFTLDVVALTAHGFLMPFNGAKKKKK